MQEFIEQAAKLIGSDPWVIVTLAVVTVITLPLGIWGLLVTIKGYKVKRPCYMLHSINVITGEKGSFNELTIHWRGHGDHIQNLTVTKIVFWNRGRETINGGDIVDAAPLLVKVREGCVVLDPKIIFAEEKNAVRIHLAPDKQSVSITFDYLDRMHGFILQIIHTGTSNDDIRLQGEIKGVDSLRKTTGQSRLTQPGLARAYLVFGIAYAATCIQLGVPLILEIAGALAVIVVVSALDFTSRPPRKIDQLFSSIKSLLPPKQPKITTIELLPSQPKTEPPRA